MMSLLILLALALSSFLGTPAAIPISGLDHSGRLTARSPRTPSPSSPDFIGPPGPPPGFIASPTPAEGFVGPPASAESPHGPDGMIGPPKPDPHMGPFRNGDGSAMNTWEQGGQAVGPSDGYNHCGSCSYDGKDHPPTNPWEWNPPR